MQGLQSHGVHCHSHADMTGRDGGERVRCSPPHVCVGAVVAGNLIQILLMLQCEQKY